jgi:hypothetical protein
MEDNAMVRLASRDRMSDVRQEHVDHVLEPRVVLTDIVSARLF